MEQAAKQESPATPAKAQKPDPKLLSIRNALVGLLIDRYGEFLKVLSTIPCRDVEQQRAFENFRTGYLYFKEGIALADISFKPVDQTGAAQPPATPEPSPSVEEPPKNDGVEL